MTEPIAVAADQVAGLVGVVQTQYLDLPRPVWPDCGRELHPARVACETYGVLGRPVEYHGTEGQYGPDCSLLEEAMQTSDVRSFLAQAGAGE